MYQKKEVERLAGKYVETGNEQVFEELIKTLIPLINVQLGKNYSSLKQFWDDLRQEVLLKVWKNREGLLTIKSISLYHFFYQRIRRDLFRAAKKVKKEYDVLNNNIVLFPEVPRPYRLELGLDDEPWGYKENNENSKNEYGSYGWGGLRGLGYADLNEIIRNSKEYMIWRENILERDSYKSILSGKINYLIVHHLRAFNLLMDECYDLGMNIDNWKNEKFLIILFNKNNGVTLAEFEHDEFHDMHGWGYNTLKQFKEFKILFNQKINVSERRN